MACILCRLVCGPSKVAAMERWIESRWDEPNNGDSFFRLDQNQDALRIAHDLRKTDQKKAFEEFLRMAEQGSVWSMRQVASSLLLGLGTSIDKYEAEKWLRRSYEAGNEGAMLSLAAEYFRQKRLNDAEALLAGYAAKDWTPALYLLGLISLRAGRKVQGRALLERASAFGHRRAKWSLGKSCFLGKFGIRSIPYGFRVLKEISNDIEKGELEAGGQANVAMPEVAT